MELRMLTIGQDIRLNANMALLDPQSHQLVFFSAFGNDSMVRRACSLISRRNSVNISRMGTATTRYKGHDFFMSKDAKTGYTTLVCSAKDEVEVNDSGVVTLKAYIFMDLPEDFDLSKLSSPLSVPEELAQKIYHKLYEHMPTPMIPEWASYIAAKIRTEHYLTNLSRVFKPAGNNMTAFKLSITSNDITRIVQEGLSSRALNINGTHHMSTSLSEIEGMDAYLTAFSSQATEKLESSFVPKFVPSKDTYNEALNTLIDYTACRPKINLYTPQKVLIQAASNNLDKNDVVFAIATPGSGKSIMGASITYAHNQDRKVMTNIVLSPGHLVEKWILEIERTIPLSKAVAVEGFEHFKQLEPLINDPNRRHHLYLIMSKDTAKSTYEKRPAVVWSSSKDAYTCPSCGGVIQKKEFVGTGRAKREVWKNLKEKDFLKEYAYNTECGNLVDKWDNKERKNVSVKCGNKLWTPSIKDTSPKWIRLGGGVGWMEKKHIRKVAGDIEAQEQPDRHDRKLLAAIHKAIEEDSNNELTVRAPRKFSMANYVRRYYKNKIDYLIADELNL